MTTVTEHRKDLLERKAELEARLKVLEDLLDDPKSASFSEQATESELDEVYEAQGMAGEKEIEAINAALRRMDLGEYGVCVSCGDLISEERLDAVPTAALCRKCMK
ncbi:MAG: TraR/DksA family transcriptional regulator [Rhizobiaceae bacterium]